MAIICSKLREEVEMTQGKLPTLRSAHHEQNELVAVQHPSLRHSQWPARLAEKVRAITGSDGAFATGLGNSERGQGMSFQSTFGP